MKHYNSREEVALKEKWNLEDIYPSKEQWEEGVKKVSELTNQLKAYNGQIHNASDLYQYLCIDEEVSKTFTLVSAYARLGNDLDTRDPQSQELLNKAESLSFALSEAVSFFFPYLLSLPEETLKNYLKEEPKLAYFEKDLMEMYRYKKHVLSSEQEEIMSQMGQAMSAPNQIFRMINNADIKFGTITKEDGTKVELTRGMYTQIMRNGEREQRKEAYIAHYEPYIQLKNSIAATLSSAIKNNVTVSKIRHYPSALDKALFGDDVPRSVYEQLISTTKKHVGGLHEYAYVRKEILGVDELHMYDASVKLVEDVEQERSFDDAYATMLKALAPLGKDYIETLSSFKDQRYIDVRETPGKMSGAYNMGVYGVHPFVLLNHQDDINSLFTLAHEMGHAMHSHFSSNHQPFPTARYSIFVAEVASTVNEVLLIHHLLNEAEDVKMRKYLLNHFIEQFRGTFFTQVMFAEFEKITHERAENNEPLNADNFNEIYQQLFKEYNGDAYTLDEQVKYNWARIPHFYRPFYVYKYATGFASAIHIATALLTGDKQIQKNYLEFLKSGSSDYPLELLKKTGVDLASGEPIENALNYFGNLVTEFKQLEY
ncbi:oligoendopeptidase F [Bacillus testis]|uniref:oligoendopeptidase F n=1 Tax=Bacillus testis TaxID=1622072 RepID=UPI00067F5A72|nr:oligoendopeptidase F [Bacillus testis]